MLKIELAQNVLKKIGRAACCDRSFHGDIMHVIWGLKLATGRPTAFYLLFCFIFLRKYHITVLP